MASQKNGEDETTSATVAATIIVDVPPLDSYELQMAEVILDPDDIESSFADIGGLDQAKQEIYELAVLPLVQPDLFPTNSKLTRPVKGKKERKKIACFVCLLFFCFLCGYI
jgi:ATP-dependent 26S proteasome regulatory subunit